MKTYTLTRDGNRDVKITADRIAEVSSKTTSGSGQNRWMEIDIYRTRAGKLLAQFTFRTQWEGEHDWHEVRVCSSEADLISALTNAEGDGCLGVVAKDALKAAGIDYAERIA